MPSGKAKRRSRKPRTTGGAPPPPAAPPRQREQRAARESATQRQAAAADRMLGSVGDRPPNPLGIPVSEIAIFLGLVCLVVGLIEGGQVATIVGAVVCGLGVTEVTAREHFSGFRSHTTLLAAIPAVIVEAVIVLGFGAPSDRGLILLPMVPVFGVCFWLLRRSFQTARHARVTRPPAP